MAQVTGPPRYVMEDDGSVTQTYHLDHDDLRFAAENCRREHTGIHAKLTISLSGILLAYSTFNVDRDEERVRLGNSAQKRVPKLASAWTADDMKHALDLFCEGLWGVVVGAFDVEEMAGEGGDVEQDFLLREYIIRGAGTMIYAPPGKGKSYTGMLMAVSMDAGNNALFDVGGARRGLYLNLERSRESMQRRLQQVNQALGMEPGRPLLFLNARGKSLNDVLDAARKAVREHKLEWVVLDSISRSGLGDLNENAPANRIVDALNGLCPSWLGLAHTPRADETHIYGSVHFDAGVDVGVQMLSESSEDGLTVGIGLKVTKANDIRKKAEPFTFALEFNELGLANVRPELHAGEFLEMRQAAQPQNIEALARDFLLQYGKATASEIGKEIGRDRSNVSRVLSKATGFVRERVGKETFYGVQALHVVP